MKNVDLRSDTVTLPTPQMRKAMYEAELGDDVYGEDPTVRRLEEVSAARLGKEAALFVASGTMGNLVSLLTHCQRGTEVIMGDQSHTFYYEAGGISALGGAHVHTVPNLPDGMMDPAEVEGYKAGKKKLLGFFMGQVMKATQGKANPGAVQEMLKEKLEE